MGSRASPQASPVKSPPPAVPASDVPAGVQSRFDDVQRQIMEVRAGTFAVAEIESTRRLTREEARWAARLRLQAAGLSCEMRAIRMEVLSMRARRLGEPPPSS